MPALAPLRFEPIFQSMLWGGDRLPGFIRRPAPTADPIGEAWMLSDVDDRVSIVAEGPFAGRSLRDVLAEFRAEIFGAAVPVDGRFPLLLKFLDARKELSVQVHPDDAQAVALHGPGHRGKTEAWVILDADPRTSRLYAGFRAGVNAETFRAAMAAHTTAETLHTFTPKVGDCVFLEAGTVHAIGANILLFEVQQTSDITYRLYDWDRIDAKTGRPRELHVDRALACSNFAAGPCHPVVPQPVGDRHELVSCPHFALHRRGGDRPMSAGEPGRCRVVVAVDGRGTLAGETFRTGDVVLLPASLGAVRIVPDGPLQFLEIGLGEGAGC